MASITISTNHTLQEIYDYQKYWSLLSANIEEEQPLTTADGVTFFLADDWDFIINTGVTVTATGQKLIMGGTGTWTLNGTAQFAGLMQDASKSRAPIKITNIVSGSRVLVERASDQTEIHNAIVSGTELTVYYEETSSTLVNVVVRNASGGTIYRSWRITGNVDYNKGFTTHVSQQVVF